MKRPTKTKKAGNVKVILQTIWGGHQFIRTVSSRHDKSFVINVIRVNCPGFDYDVTDSWVGNMVFENRQNKLHGKLQTVFHRRRDLADSSTKIKFG